MKQLFELITLKYTTVDYEYVTTSVWVNVSTIIEMLSI